MYVVAPLDREPVGESVWIGGPPGDRAGRDFYAVSRDGRLLYHAAILWHFHDGDAPAPLAWEEAGVAVLAQGDELYALSLPDGAVRRHQDLDERVVDLALSRERDRLLVVDLRDVLAFDRQLRRLWTADRVGREGLALEELRDDLVVLSDGGGRVALDLATGHEVFREGPRQAPPGPGAQPVL
jgi:hypothetical protein